MKKWIYLIFPAVLLVGLFVVYKGHVKEAEEKAQVVAAKVAKDRADAEAKKQAAEAKARADAKKRQDERDAEEKKKADEKSARQAADDKKVAEQTAEFLAKVTAAQKQITALEAELDRLRKDEDRASRENFDAAKKIELARIARRNSELEIQRTTEMIAKRAEQSSMTRPPPPPPPPPAKK
jgi:murein DD-endopeptidase MepM/ murein hydrolase activator NlpD